jgi:hypothetical protein
MVRRKKEEGRRKKEEGRKPFDFAQGKKKEEGIGLTIDN